ncbi:hypothetical protein EB796_003098 [Bugula neritina]|uniref:DHRS7B n=1 Tax=Bugula neritina TaxID=10212 RepID=A0A7J7KLC9_BUGNE|nr:hypothetical protein EB796_003098 [Bugula neritina]
MDSLERYLPKWPETSLQMGLTAAGAAIVSFLLLRGLFKQRKQLKGKVVVITGASSGIGEALATEFVQKGCKVILAARSIEKLKQLKEKLVSSYKIAEDSIACFFLDLEDHDAIEEACSSLLALYGKVDILVNNAGISGGDRVEKCHLQTYKKIMDINYFGQVALTKGMHYYDSLLQFTF